MRVFVAGASGAIGRLGGVAEGSREHREKRYGPTQNAAMPCRPESPKTKRCAVARKETMRCRFAPTKVPDTPAPQAVLDRAQGTCQLVRRLPPHGGGQLVGRFAGSSEQRKRPAAA